MKNLLNKIELKSAGILLALAMSILALVGGHQSAPKAGTLDTTNYTVFPNCVASGDLGSCWTKLSMAAATSTVFLKNTSSGTEWVDLAQAITDGTASSSYRIFMSTTTAPESIISGGGTPAAIPLYTTPTYAGIMKAVAIATSTTATSTDQLTAGNAYGNDSTPVKAGEWLAIGLQSGCTAQAASAVTGMCESATSTNRGFNLTILLNTHSTSTPQQ